jgi:hypothetical protein
MTPPGVKHGENITGHAEGTPLCSQLADPHQRLLVRRRQRRRREDQGHPELAADRHDARSAGVNGPPRVGFRAFRSYGGGEPYTQGGPPRIDQQRFEFMSGRAGGSTDADPYEHVNPTTGFINEEGGDQKGDFAAWASVGPWLHLQPKPRFR